MSDTTNYSKQFEEQDAKLKAATDRIEAQQKMIDQLVQDKQDTERYSKVTAILRTKELPEGQTEKEILADAFAMGEDEFERYSKTLNWLPAKADVIETNFYMDPNLDREQYARRTGGTSHSQADIEKYTRLAANMAVKLNDKKPGTTTFEEQWEIIAKANGIPV